MNRAEYLDREINDTVVSLKYLLLELRDEYGVDRFREIIEYLQEADAE